MGKPAYEEKTRELDTKILFKRSMNTTYTNSSCCIGASQLVNKSGYFQIRRNSDGTKLKRDLSIETDACILRRYYKTKRHKMSNQGSSVISKYSTVVDTEIETIEEFPDSSACGDNEIIEARSNHPLDIEALVVANLRNLLSQWFQNKVLCNKNTQNKLENVLDSILHKLNSKTVHKTSSDSTYVIHKAEQKQQVKNKKIATSAMACQYCKSCRGKIQTSSAISRQDSSTLTIPSYYKGIRIISTLSMPRSFHSPKLDEKISNNSLLYKLRKLKRQHVILSIDKSNKLLNSSNFDVIAFSTKSLPKRCAHCDNSSKKKRHLVLLPKSFRRNTSNTSNNTKQPKVKGKFDVTDEISSLLKSIYTTSIDKNVQFNSKNDNFTMTENISEHILNLNILQAMPQSNDYQEPLSENKENINKKNQSNSFIKNDQIPSFPDASAFKSTKNPIQSRKYKYSQKKHIFGRSMVHSKFNNVYNKKHTYLNKKSSNPLRGREFVKYCRSVFRYVTDQDIDKNIKVDVRINIFPMGEPRNKDTCTNVSNLPLESYDMKDQPTLLYDNDNTGSTTIDSQPYIQPNTVLDVEYEQDPTICSSHCTVEIIPLLDGAVSQANYIFSVNSGEKMDVKSDVVTGDTNQLGILQEISELRAVIKDLALTAEKLVTEHIKNKAIMTNAATNFSEKMGDNYTFGARCEAESIPNNIFKTTQVSIEIEKKQAHSETMNETQTKSTFNYDRVTKRSTSYRIIDSESLLKVTDMTSKANKIKEFNRRFADQALTCSLPKSRSLFEMTSDRNRKLIAFFCDNYVNSKEKYVKANCKLRDSRSSATCPRKSKTSTKSKKCKRSKKSSKSDTKYPCSPTQSPPSIPLPISCPDGGGYSSTLSCRSMNSYIDEDDDVVCKVQRRGMGFGEGCVYCLLLWIPIAIIVVVFYSYVLRDEEGSSENKTEHRISYKSDYKTDYTTPKTTTRRYMYQADVPRTTSYLRNSSRLYFKLSDLGF